MFKLLNHVKNIFFIVTLLIVYAFLFCVQLECASLEEKMQVLHGAIKQLNEDITKEFTESEKLAQLLRMIHGRLIFMRSRLLLPEQDQITLSPEHHQLVLDGKFEEIKEMMRGYDFARVIPYGASQPEILAPINIIKLMAYLTTIFSDDEKLFELIKDKAMHSSVSEVVGNIITHNVPYSSLTSEQVLEAVKAFLTIIINLFERGMITPAEMLAKIKPYCFQLSLHQREILSKNEAFIEKVREEVATTMIVRDSTPLLIGLMRLIYKRHSYFVADKIHQIADYWRRELLETSDVLECYRRLLLYLDGPVQKVFIEMLIYLYTDRETLEKQVAGFDKKLADDRKRLSELERAAKGLSGDLARLNGFDQKEVNGKIEKQEKEIVWAKKFNPETQYLTQLEKNLIDTLKTWEPVAPGDLSKQPDFDRDIRKMLFITSTFPMIAELTNPIAIKINRLLNESAFMLAVKMNTVFAGILSNLLVMSTIEEPLVPRAVEYICGADLSEQKDINRLKENKPFVAEVEKLVKSPNPFFTEVKTAAGVELDKSMIGAMYCVALADKIPEDLQDALKAKILASQPYAEKIVEQVLQQPRWGVGSIGGLKAFLIQIFAKLLEVKALNPEQIKSFMQGPQSRVFYTYHALGVFKFDLAWFTDDLVVQLLHDIFSKITLVPTELPHTWDVKTDFNEHVQVLIKYCLQRINEILSAPVNVSKLHAVVTRYNTLFTPSLTTQEMLDKIRNIYNALKYRARPD